MIAKRLHPRSQKVLVVLGGVVRGPASEGSNGGWESVVVHGDPLIDLSKMAACMDQSAVIALAGCGKTTERLLFPEFLAAGAG
jgi:hypothetical protein